jgi:general secretion pathway protein G
MTFTPRATAKRSTAPSIATGEARGGRVAGSERRRAPLVCRAASQRGWTLIELVVVMSIIAILASIAMTTHRHAVTLGREAVLKEDLFRMRDAIDQYYADKTKYPADLQALVTDGYLRDIPVDPFTNSRDTWQTIPAESDPSNPSAEPGIFNVRTGSDQTSMQGQPYTDW